MATYDVTGPGGTNRPSRRNPGVRTPYLVENTIDISAINGDVVQQQMMYYVLLIYLLKL